MRASAPKLELPVAASWRFSVNSVFQRCAAAVIGFGFFAVVLSLGVGSAFECLLSAAAFYGAAAFAQRKRVDRFTKRFMDGSPSEPRGRPERRQRRTDVPRRRAYDYA